MRVRPAWCLSSLTKAKVSWKTLDGVTTNEAQKGKVGELIGYLTQTVGRLTPHNGGCSMQVTAAREVTVFYSVPSVAW